jgi:hypothetical protein
MKNKFDGQGKIHNILIKFKSPELQNNFFFAKKRSGPLLYQQLFFTKQNGNKDGMKEIYINETLTLYNQESQENTKNGINGEAFSSDKMNIEQSPIRKIKMISNLQSKQLHDYQEHQLI